MAHKLETYQAKIINHFVNFFDNDPEIEGSLDNLARLETREVDLALVIAVKAEELWGSSLDKNLACCVFLRPFIEEKSADFLQDTDFNNDIKEMVSEINVVFEKFEKEELDPAEFKENTKDYIQLISAYSINIFNGNFKDLKEIDWEAADRLCRLMMAMGESNNAGLNEMVEESLNIVIQMSEYRNDPDYKIIQLGMQP